MTGPYGHLRSGTGVMDCKRYINKIPDDLTAYKVEDIPAIIGQIDVPPQCYHAVFNFLYQNIKIDAEVYSLDALDHYMADVNSYPLLSEADEKKVFELYQRKKSRETKNLIVKTNLRLVINIAKKYINKSNRSMLQDLIEEGNIGLLVAVEKYDLSRNTRFATYAAYWIKHYIQEYLYKNTTMLKFSDRVFHKYLKYKKIVGQYNNTNTPVDEEALKRDLNVDDYTLMILSSLFYKPVELEDEYNHNSVYDKNMYSVDNTSDDIARDMINETIKKTVDELSARERIVLGYRYGISGKETMPLSKIGEMMGVSKQRISQIEKSALNKLKKKLKKENL